MSKISTEDCRAAIIKWYESDDYPDWRPRGKFDIKKRSTGKTKTNLVTRTFEMVFYTNEPTNLDEGAYVYSVIHTVDNPDGTISLHQYHPDEG